MVKSLHRSLEAKLASIKDLESSESEDEHRNESNQIETISAKRIRKGNKPKSSKKDVTKATDDDMPNQPSTVIYLGHLPVGFEEHEITVFLNQFGNVKRCRVSRSTKTGRSRGYAFVDFADEEVAKIVAETMSGYLLLEKRLVSHVLPNAKVHELMFAKPKRIPTKAGRQKKAREEVNKHRSVDVLKGITTKLVKREEMKRKKLATLGIDYEFPGYAASAQSVLQSNSTSEKKRKMSEGDGNAVGGDDVDGHDTKSKTTKDNDSQVAKEKEEEKESKTDNANNNNEEKENGGTNVDAEDDAHVESSSSKKKKKSAKSVKKAKRSKAK